MNEQLKIILSDAKIILRIALWLGVLLGALFLLRLYGFSTWTTQEAIAAVTAVRWDHLAALVVGLFLYTHAARIGSLIERIRTGKFSKDGFETQFDPINQVNEQQALQAETTDRLTIDDVKELLGRVRQLDKSKIADESSVAHSWLLRNGIRTRTRMLDLVEATAVFDFLSKVYVSELHRSPDAPLDPVAVGTWGVALFTYGLRDDVMQYIVSQIRKSAEYQERNGQ